MAAPIHVARQLKADLERDIHGLKADARKILETPSKDHTPEQKAALDALDKKIDAKNADLGATLSDIARLEKYQEDERKQGAAAAGDIQVGADRATEQPWGPVVASDAPAYLKDEARHMALGTFAQAVRQAAGGKFDPRLQAAATGAGTQSDSNLGFAVPAEVAPGIEREMYETGEILGRVDARTISGNTITYNVLNETSRATGSRGGGIVGYWVDEGTAPTASNTSLAKLELKLRKVGAFGVMTDELLSDAVALGGELEQAFAAELQFQVEDKIYRGDGAAGPLGFLNAACLVSVAKETGQGAATIVNDNVLKMWARVPSRSKRNAVWLYNTECGPQLQSLTQAIGTGGVLSRYVTVADDGTLRIFGRPALEVEYAAALGTVGDLACVDLAKYRLIRKGGVEQASSMHVYFSTGEQAFRAFYRVDGQPVPRAAITPYKGSATLSPFVVLATRA